MSATPDPERFFSARHRRYERFVRALRYRQSLRAALRASPLLRARLRILEAGCGTGALTLALLDALAGRGLEPEVFQAFDLTPAMLDSCRAALQLRSATRVELARANVLDLSALPESWTGYDLVVTASMLEYVPREQLADALRGLRSRLREGGHLMLFITRRNPLMRLLVGWWWASNLYTRRELERALRSAGYTAIEFCRFPPPVRQLALWGHYVVAQ
jgi:SAM-dependent methyltransferase